MLSEVTRKVTDHQLIPVKTGKLKHISLEGHLMLSFVNTDKDDSGGNWPNSPFSPAEGIPGPVDWGQVCMLHVHYSEMGERQR